MDSWLNYIEQNASKNVYKILIGNKCDMDYNRKVTIEEGKNFAENYGMKFFEISAKQSINVFEAINTMTRDIIFTFNKRKFPLKGRKSNIIKSNSFYKYLNKYINY